MYNNPLVSCSSIINQHKYNYLNKFMLLLGHHVTFQELPLKMYRLANLQLVCKRINVQDILNQLNAMKATLRVVWRIGQVLLDEWRGNILLRRYTPYRAIFQLHLPTVIL